jgi:hypothetical protein
LALTACPISSSTAFIRSSHFDLNFSKSFLYDSFIFDSEFSAFYFCSEHFSSYRSFSCSDRFSCDIFSCQLPDSFSNSLFLPYSTS